MSPTLPCHLLQNPPGEYCHHLRGVETAPIKQSIQHYNCVYGQTVKGLYQQKTFLVLSFLWRLQGKGQSCSDKCTSVSENSV